MNPTSLNALELHIDRVEPCARAAGKTAAESRSWARRHFATRSNCKPIELCVGPWRSAGFDPWRMRGRWATIRNRGPISEEKHAGPAQIQALKLLPCKVSDQGLSHSRGSRLSRG